jgi:hypothetical protein
MTQLILTEGAIRAKLIAVYRPLSKQLSSISNGRPGAQILLTMAVLYELRGEVKD